MNPSEFYKNAINNEIISTQKATCKTTVMKSPNLGVIVETGVDFNLLGRKGNSFHAMSSKILLENLNEASYNKLVKVAQIKFDDPNLQHSYVAKELIKNHSPVRIYEDKYVRAKTGADKLFGGASIKDYEKGGVLNDKEIERFLDGIKKIAVPDLSVLNRSLEYKSSINNISPKSLLGLTEEIREMIDLQRYNLNAEYPCRIQGQVNDIISKLENTNLMIDESLSMNKINLLESLRVISVTSERHFTFHDDMQRRDEERNESFDCEDNERHAEEAFEHSRQDFEENKLKLDDELLYVENRNKRFKEAVLLLDNEINKSAENSFSM